MDDLKLNADIAQTVIVHATQLPWLASPELGVERRLLERSGGEIARASTIVRYQPGSRFHPHKHDLGEEFLVLEGTFSDEYGHYPAGTYVRNPPGSVHAPFSKDGCVIFVKLRQMQINDAHRVRVFAHQQQWQPAGAVGHERAQLHSADGVNIALERINAGGSIPSHTSVRGEEIFVVSGDVQLIDDRQMNGQQANNSNVLLNTWSWLRRSGNKHPALVSNTGALLWTKRGHLM